jgi:hypothetical protein
MFPYFCCLSRSSSLRRPLPNTLPPPPPSIFRASTYDRHLCDDDCVDECLQLGFKTSLLKAFIPACLGPARLNRMFRPLEGWNQALRSPFTIKKNYMHAVFAFPNLEFESLAQDPGLNSPSSPMMQQVMAMAAKLCLVLFASLVKKPLWTHQSSMAKPS